MRPNLMVLFCGHISCRYNLITDFTFLICEKTIIFTVSDVISVKCVFD